MNHKVVDIIIRSINGKWITVRAPFYEIAAKVRECTCEEDEIMLVSVDGMVLWCALGRDIPLDIEDIAGFFA